MRSRDLLTLAAIVLGGAVVVAVLSLQTGGGMMGGMGGMMGGMALVGVLFFIAIAFLVLALVARPSVGTPLPPFPLSPATVAPAPPPIPAPESPSIPATSTSAVEAAVVKLLGDDERLLYTRIRDACSPVLQKDVVAWGTFSAAKVTRLLDRLEKKGLVVRERYGMTNRIRLAYGLGISGR